MPLRPAWFVVGKVWRVVDGPDLQHLVVARFEESTSGRHFVQLLRKSIRALGVDGSFSVVIDRQRGAAIHCLFELEQDALRLARAMNARRTDSYPGWQSQRVFSLERAYARARSLADTTPARAARDS